MRDTAGHSGTWWRRRRLWPVQCAPAVSAVALGSPFALALQGLPVGTGPGRRNGNNHHLTVPATGRGESTIRSHVKEMFAKHGLSRQAELVRLVLSLAGAPESRR